MKEAAAAGQQAAAPVPRRYGPLSQREECCGERLKLTLFTQSWLFSLLDVMTSSLIHAA